jgi:hypothetical protein
MKTLYEIRPKGSNNLFIVTIITFKNRLEKQNEIVYDKNIIHNVFTATICECESYINLHKLGIKIL